MNEQFEEKERTEKVKRRKKSTKKIKKVLTRKKKFDILETQLAKRKQQREKISEN